MKQLQLFDTGRFIMELPASVFNEAYLKNEGGTAVVERLSVTMPISSPIIPAGIYICPDCGEAAGKRTETIPHTTTQDAGGHLFPWTSYVGRYLCGSCGHDWHENIS